MEDRIILTKPSFNVATGTALSLVVVTMVFWLIAFFHMPEANPKWLAVVQSVCFGTGENGLPNAGGWLLLIAAPLSFMVALVVAFANDIWLGVSWLFQTGAGRRVLGLFLVLLLVEGVWIGNRLRTAWAISNANYASIDNEHLPEFYPRVNTQAPDFSLVDQDGRTVSLSSLAGKPAIITFAFAHCKTICPIIITSIRDAVSKVPEAQARIVVITLDPWRDTPSALMSLAKEWQLLDKGYVLSGNPDEVSQVIELYHVPQQRDLKTGDITHPALAYIIDANSQIAYSFNNPSSQWLSDALKRVGSQ